MHEWFDQTSFPVKPQTFYQSRGVSKKTDGTSHKKYPHQSPDSELCFSSTPTWEICENQMSHPNKILRPAHLLYSLIPLNKQSNRSLHDVVDLKK